MTDDLPRPPEAAPATGAPSDRPAPKRIPFRRRLAQPSLEYRSALGKWLAAGEPLDDHAGQVATHAWWKVIWLTGARSCSCT